MPRAPWSSCRWTRAVADTRRPLDARADPARRGRTAPSAWPAVAGAGAGACWASDAQAHGLGQPYDLPAPLGFYLAGAGAAVLLSFVVTALMLRGPRRRGLYRRVTLGWSADGAALLGGLQAVGVAIFLGLVTAGLVGEQDAFKNILPITVWVLWWIGFTFVCAGVGNLWPLVNPYVALYEWAAAVWVLVAGTRASGPRRAYPERWGALPAAALFLGFVWMEVVWTSSEVPRALATAMIGYGAFTWIGMALFGPEPWLRNGEVFTVYFRILGRFAPLGPEVHPQDGRLELRPFAAALMTPVGIHWSMVVFVLLMLAAVTFDGFTETTAWAGLAAVAGAWVPGIGDGLLVTLAWVLCAGLFVLVFYLFAWVTAAAGCGPAGRSGVGETAGFFVLTLVPIAIAYHVAHYLSFLLVAGQYAIPLLSDPLGWGWDLFGTTLYRVDFSVIDARAIWYVAIAAVVAGHVIAVHLAHATALRIYPTPRRALLSQVPMVALMVGYTMLSLWILSQPIVRRG